MFSLRRVCSNLYRHHCFTPMYKHKRSFSCGRSWSGVIGSKYIRQFLGPTPFFVLQLRLQRMLYDFIQGLRLSITLGMAYNGEAFLNLQVVTEFPHFYTVKLHLVIKNQLVIFK